jgi:cytochrome b6-f complex iron-sulfur subunit/menaquinol-cytochrome c reductase iron-sulfur subunit
MSSEPESKQASPDTREAVPTTSRRGLALATALGACALAAAAAGPSLTLALAPLRTTKRGGRWVRTVRLDQLEEGRPRRVAVIDDRKDAWTVERGVELGSVWLVRQGEKVLALSAVCPHLGCSVNAVETQDGKGAAGFACPCHTSAFDPSGKRTSGPSPRDLDALETKVEDGHVAVDFRRFRIGIEEKVET